MKLITKLLIFILLIISLDFLLELGLKKGIDNYYGLNQKSKILIIGHSHLMLATDKKKLEEDLGVKVSKYTREGVNIYDKKKMIEHFFNSGNADSLKYVLYGVDLYSFTGEGLSNNSYKLFYPFMDDNELNDYIKENDNSTNYFINKFFRSYRYNEDAIKNGVWRGWLNNWDNYKNNSFDVEKYQQSIKQNEELEINFDNNLISEFKETVNYVLDNGVKVILVNTPTIDILNKSQGKNYNRIMEWFKNYSEETKNVLFWDFNPDFSNRYEIFSDKIHLNKIGQELITDSLVYLIKKLN